VPTPPRVWLQVTQVSSNQASMNLTSSHPFWSVNNGLPANYPSLQHNVSCDAVVIGGGIAGAPVAVHLAEPGTSQWPDGAWALSFAICRSLG
jgi:hypothetical protein